VGLWRRRAGNEASAQTNLGVVSFAEIFEHDKDGRTVILYCNLAGSISSSLDFRLDQSWYVPGLCALARLRLLPQARLWIEEIFTIGS
jgi:hypothetical protein